MVKVFIDGSSGTTGLRIYDRLSIREDIHLINLPESLRKDNPTKQVALNSADVVFLCLPDDAAKQSVSMVKNPNTVIIDTSTAHRTNPDWTYGFLEMGDLAYKNIKASKRICVPGCHALGFIALVAPLIQYGIVARDYPFSCTSLTGYSGGGKTMISDYESQQKDATLSAPRLYALDQQHKHLKEMQYFTGIDNPPVFNPIVCDLYSMMCVTVNIAIKDISIISVCKVYEEKYRNQPLIDISDLNAQNYSGFIVSNSLSNKDSMRIHVTGNDQRISLTALYDNLGKGASGSAIQCFNVITGCDPTKGLVI